MKGNGFKLFLTAFFVLVCGFYLWPTVRYQMYQNDLKKLTDTELDAFQEENGSKIRAAKEKALKLGLDLQGGMHVTLEVNVESLVRRLATDTDDTFEAVMLSARDRVLRTDEPFVDAFVSEFEDRDGEARLSRYFRNDNENINRRSDNSDVAGYLRKEGLAAVDRAVEIIRDRVDRYGVTEPSILKQGNRRIVVELPGVDDPDRVRSLLKGTARLEFRLMADESDLARSLQTIIQHFEVTEVDTADVAAADTTLGIDDLLDTGGDEPSNELLRVLTPIGQSVEFAAVSSADTAAVNALLSDPIIENMLPPDIELLYTASPIGQDASGNDIYKLLGVSTIPQLEGDVIVDSRVDFDPQYNTPEVTMAMNSEGSKTWARLTGANIGKNVAIVLDGVVYSYPTVISKIVGGRSNIDGLASQEEAQDIVTILKSGALPAPVEVEEERMVGPSLGAKSIRAGFQSVMFGLLLVALFMVFYYRTGGIVAVLALLLNILFVLGILAAFQATLTLPGIAGNVLTIGMAVDANVLIFERIREEQSTGKTLKAALEGGYAKALSAIVDANITTFFVAAILYSFGVGPIKGFAVTLMAGIAASMFSAIVITRIVFDYLIVDRKKSVSYG
ncbi:MAG: protein translocase subunit SecD [Rhodothermales bacterium]|nr:protein translocase subunit SecD [Rhodothermales bacterium]